MVSNPSSIIDFNIKTRKNNTNKYEYRQHEKIDQKRRPNICTTEKYIQNQKVVPENRTYVNDTKHGNKTMVIGDSHIKRIKRNLFNDSFETAKSYIKILVNQKLKT